MKNKKVVICSIPDWTLDKDLEKHLKNDPILIEAIREYSKKLDDNDNTIFTKKLNMIETFDGYYLAVFEEDAKYLPIRML